MPPMSRTPFHRCLSLLALIAVLLMMAMPVASRLVQAGGMSGSTPASWSQLCTVAGLKWVDLAAPAPAKLLKGALLNDAAPEKNPAAASHDGDCPYCPLAASLILLLVWLLLAAPGWVVRHGQRPAPAQLHRGHPCGLGSRGPPLAV